MLVALNGLPVNGTKLEDGRSVREIIENPASYPLKLKFTRPKMTTNEKIFLASMFYPLFAIASQLSPEPKSSGIEVLEADTFKLNCFQTLTGQFVAGCFLPAEAVAECAIKTDRSAPINVSVTPILNSMMIIYFFANFVYFLCCKKA